MQNHHEADPKQQCDRDANDATKSFDAESYDFDTVWPGPNCDRHKRFSQNERRTADQQNDASELFIFA